MSTTGKKSTRKKTARKSAAGKKKTTRKGLKKTRKKTRKKARRRDSARARAPVPRLWISLIKGLSAVAVVALVVVGLYGLVLDARIKDRFVGQPWEQPARVYARGIDLYTGLELSRDELQRYLQASGYRQVSQPANPGEFARSGDHIRLVSRGLTEAAVPSLALDVFFSGNTLIELRDGNNNALPLATLEPPMIGSILARGGEDRMVVGSSEVPSLLIAALKAVEDRRFDTHHGLDLRGIARAAWTNLKAGRVRQGGSTITQQLIKSHFLSNEQTWRRKFNEALMAISIDARMQKRDIMLAYINEIYLGQDGGRAIHGFDLASRFYFSRRLSELELHQVALLTGMVRGPSQYNPRRHPSAALQRRNQVLDILREQQVISEEASATAKTLPLGIVEDRTGNVAGYPAVLAMVNQQLLEDYQSNDLTSKGLSVFTTLDVLAQQRVERSIERSMNELEQQHTQISELQTAAAVLAPDTGELIALVGGRTAGFDGFNRALDMRRPVGSLIKPFVFLTALESGRFDLDTLVSNEALDVELENGTRWQPRNFTREYGGEVPIFRALTESINTPTVRVGLDVGVERVIDTLREFGLERDIDPFPSVVLGAVDLSPLDMATLYLGLADRGFVTPPRVVTSVKDATGAELKRYPLEVRQAVSSISAYQVLQTLQVAAERGTGRSLRAHLPNIRVAGKTGSTNDLRDSWFAGISQSAVAVVWVGRDDNTPINLTGAQGALPVWAGVMRALNASPLAQYAPDSLAQAPFDYVSGAPLPYCESAVLIPLRPNPERPSQYDCR